MASIASAVKKQLNGGTQSIDKIGQDLANTMKTISIAEKDHEQDPEDLREDMASRYSDIHNTIAETNKLNCRFDLMKSLWKSKSCEKCTMIPQRKLTKKKKYRLRGRSSETAKAHRG
eukprot:TRINITY_DN1363_c0_g1_i1.p1 TRINITY_DN1363_c0_g1~~TRINITY_DN1363_c0_g1_i1.p1  ORF type:complete len:117 (+),score=44.11 TRINITY_DN1363_c0_g1_i1:298-648(+)